MEVVLVHPDTKAKVIATDSQQVAAFEKHGFVVVVEEAKKEEKGTK